MSERCSHCHRIVRRACSGHAGRVQVQALQSCGNMAKVDRYREAACCDGAESSDRELAICMALEALCGEEPSLMAVASQQRFQPPRQHGSRPRQMTMRRGLTG